MSHKILQRIKRAWKTARLTANLMVGVPDYENYVAQQRKHNPNAPVMTELQFQDYCRKRRCGANCCTTGPNAAGGSASRCAGTGHWATYSPGRIQTVQRTSQGKDVVRRSGRAWCAGRA